MRIGITGTRDIENTAPEANIVRKAMINEDWGLSLGDEVVTQVTTGGAKGIDRLAFFMAIDIWPDAHHRVILPKVYNGEFVTAAFECRADVIYTGLEPLERNHVILDHTDYLLAFPKTRKEVLRSGTWATIRYAKKRDLPLKIVPLEDEL